METLANIPPSFLLFAGAIVTVLLKGTLRNVFLVALPILTFIHIAYLPSGNGLQVSFLPGFGDSELLRVDKLSKAFGYIFTLNAAAALLFAFYVKKAIQHTAALIYIGSALGVIFAGDLITLYINWELMAVSSTFVILARDTAKAKGAAFLSLIHI